MKVGIYQFSPEFGNIKKNTERVINSLKGHEFDLIVLPELFSTGYQFLDKTEAFSLAEEPEKSYCIGRLTELAVEKSAYIVGGFAEKSGKRVYNSAFLLGKIGVVGIYRKAHLFFEEKDVFDSGNTEFQVFDIKFARIGLMICFDWIYPETARILSLKGADIICHPSNLVLPYCPEAMKTRSIENRIFSITANRIGFEQRGKKEKLTYIGQSQLVSPKGELLFRMECEEEVRFAEINVEMARDKKITGKNSLFKDRRIDLYSLLTK